MSTYVEPKKRKMCPNCDEEFRPNIVHQKYCVERVLMEAYQKLGGCECNVANGRKGPYQEPLTLEGL